MKNLSSRRGFIQRSSLGAIGIFGLSTTSFGNVHLLNPISTEPIYSGFPSQDPKMIQAVVGASHTNLDRVRELVTAQPELAKGTWDWGFGDWESALGAASHMGRRDIADFLISHGARPNLYTFAMMGQIKAVRGMIESMPGVQRVPGPHGITLLGHAKNGLRWKEITEKEKTEVEEVIDYLTKLGDADQKATNLDITEEEQKTFFGKYKFGEADDEVLTVELNRRGTLFIRRGDNFGRAMLRVEENAFAPGGAPSVRIRFEVSDGKATTLTVHDPEPVVKGIRI